MARVLIACYIACLIGSVSCRSCRAHPAPTDDKPVVDLGYGLWQSTFNVTGQYYNFSNIRYAQPPVGDLRFAVPQPPLTNRSSINDGQDGRVCPQAVPIWAQERALFIKQYFADPKNISSFTNVPPPGLNPKAPPPGQPDGRATEDCLFLDVLVPKGVFNNADMKSKGGAPVMMWTYGGGFYEGSKESQGNPAGLLGQSITNASPGAIYVAINYRLGALGWLAGPTFSKSGGTANLGLYDQRLALKWIQDNIAKFGGDPARVTMMGESAGASSTLHQITAYGGTKGDAPFKQAFLSSPAYNPNPYPPLQEQNYQRFLQVANVSNLAQLRALPSEAIIRANELIIYNTSYGGGGLGPVVDGSFVPDLPVKLLQQGKYSKNVDGMFAGHNSDEGFIFANPAIQNTTAFNAYVKASVLPAASPAVVDLVINKLYPPVFDNLAALGYNDSISRLSTLLADFLVTCNAQSALDNFGPDKTHGYLFAEGLGLHGEDNPYLFYTYGANEKDDISGTPVNPASAKALQDWVTSFVIAGSPDGLPQKAPNDPIYGANRTLGLLSSKAAPGTPVMDPAQKERCDFWLSGAWYANATSA